MNKNIKMLKLKTYTTNMTPTSDLKELRNALKGVKIYSMQVISDSNTSLKLKACQYTRFKIDKCLNSLTIKIRRDILLALYKWKQEVNSSILISLL